MVNSKKDMFVSLSVYVMQTKGQDTLAIENNFSSTNSNHPTRLALSTRTTFMQVASQYQQNAQFPSVISFGDGGGHIPFVMVLFLFQNNSCTLN